MGDLAETRKFRQLIMNNLKTKVMDHLLLVHYQATILCPATKGKRYLSDIDDGDYDKRDEALDDLRRLLSWLSDEIAKGNEPHENMSISAESDNEESAETDVDLDEKEDDEFEDAILFEADEYASRRSARIAAQQELDTYLQTIYDKKSKDRAWRNPLRYWMSDGVKSMFPHLHIIAIWILSIPASSCACERLFSIAALVLSSRRHKMNPDTLAAICTLKKRRRDQ